MNSVDGSNGEADDGNFLFSGSLLPAILKGTVAGLAAVVIWAAYLAFARAGMNAGLEPQDFVLLRFGTAGILMAPWLLFNNPKSLANVGWSRAFALALLAGPLFTFVSVAGYKFAPLSHGAVIQPSTVTLVSLFAAAVFLGEKLNAAKIVGTVIIIIGLLLIASQTSTGSSGSKAWIGDLLFVIAGLCWAGFTIMLKQWRLSGFQATAALSLVAALVVVPIFFASSNLNRIAALAPAELVMQIAVQGVLAGVIAVIAFGYSVQVLGASRAAMFPALVPAATLVLGVPITGEIPTAIEWFGGAVTSVGLLVAVGLLAVILKGLLRFKA